MNKLMELYEKRNKAVADAFLDNKRGESDILSDEDNATYTKMENSIMALTKEIERESRLTAIDAEMSKPTSSPILGTPTNAQTNEKPKTGIATNEYKESMLNALRSNFRRISNVLQEGVDADGGYLVPTEYDTRLIEGLTEENIMRKLATIIKTGAERKINIAASRPCSFVCLVHLVIFLKSSDFNFVLLLFGATKT